MIFFPGFCSSRVDKINDSLPLIYFSKIAESQGQEHYIHITFKQCHMYLGILVINIIIIYATVKAARDP